MRNFLITMTRDAIDADAARAYVQASTRPDHPRDLVETDGGVGVYPFIDRVEHLFGPNPQPEYNEYRSVDANGRVAWTLDYGEGQGDMETVAANVGWFDTEFPEVLDILGITVACSAGMWGAQPVTLPRRPGADPGSGPTTPTQPSPEQPDNDPARSTSRRIGIDPQQFDDPALIDLGDIEGPLTLVGLAAHLDGNDYYARVRKTMSPWAIAVRRSAGRRDGGSEPWVRGVALAQPGHEVAVATLLRGGFAEEHDLALVARGFGDRGGVWSLLPDDTLGDSDYCQAILVSNGFVDGVRLEQGSLHFWPGYDSGWPYAVYEVRADGDVVGFIIDCPEPEIAAESEAEASQRAAAPETLRSGLTRAQDTALRDAIRAGFENLPGYHAGPAMKPLMDALAPVVADLIQQGAPSSGGSLTDASAARSSWADARSSAGCQRRGEHVR